MLLTGNGRERHVRRKGADVVVCQEVRQIDEFTYPIHFHELRSRPGGGREGLMVQVGARAVGCLASDVPHAEIIPVPSTTPGGMGTYAKVVMCGGQQALHIQRCVGNEVARVHRGVLGAPPERRQGVVHVVTVRGAVLVLHCGPRERQRCAGRVGAVEARVQQVTGHGPKQPHRSTPQPQQMAAGEVHGSAQRDADAHPLPCAGAGGGRG